MKKLSFALIVFLFVMTGCAAHSYRIQGERARFSLQKPWAKTVLFASSLDGYTPHSATRISATTWEIVVPADTALSYFYVVDGAVYLPDCLLSEMDDFGSRNCLFAPDS
ncbi:hypothetical protein ACFL0Q_07565 [Thermodesulfobacteriota bacterium]